MTINEHNPLPLDGLLAHLQARGFVLGVDRHLRVRQLLARIGAEPCSLEQVKTLLGPLFATNREEQREFYRAFDQYVAALASEPVPAPVPVPAPPARRSWRRFRLTAYAIAIALLLAATALVATQRFRLLVGLDQLQLPEVPAWIPPRPIKTVVITIITGDPQPREIPRPQPPPPPPDWMHEHRWALRLLAIALPLLALGLWLLWRWWRRRPAIERAAGRRPPFTWPIELEPEEWRLDRSPLYRQAARGLRRRQRDDFEHLDMPRTIEATIESRGYTQFRYRRASRVPEYLLLIDRASRHDHQARYFELLAESLEHDGLFVVRYFYDGDPRVCHAPSQKPTTDNRQPTTANRDRYLIELQRRYPGHRLILMGDGAKLFDPVSGEYARWTELLSEWQDRAVLTPSAPGGWRRRERLLRQLFTLQPGTLAGLAELAERYDQPLRDDSPGGEADPPPPDVRYGVTIEALRAYLGDEAFQWLCACAFYPELQWDLTMHLGRLALPAADGLDEAALWRLLRLPWFREGVIPGEICYELVRALDPARAKAVHEFLIETLEANPAEPGTFAADERRLDIAVQKAWLAGDDRAARKKALDEIADLPPGELARDYTIIRLLDEKPTTLLALLLPRRFRQWAYPEGLSIYGVRWQAAALFALMAALALLGGLEGALRYRAAHRPPPVISGPTPTPRPELSPPPARPSPTPSPTATPLPVGKAGPTQTAVVTVADAGKQQQQQQQQNPPAPRQIQIEMVPLPGGTFLMGSPPNERGRVYWEGPQHLVRVSPFLIGKYEVTQAQWVAVMGTNPSSFKGDNLPVERVSWQEVQEFCDRLSKLTGQTWRLPTEAEWEYAARAGTTGPYAGNLDAMAWYGKNSGNQTHPVGTKQPNRWGLHDMHGNVWEWCSDWYGERYYAELNNQGVVTDPKGPSLGSNRVIRGGSWDYGAVVCRSAYRGYADPGLRVNALGVRLVRVGRIP
ncbi:MAG: formylglycine-generating enzyme family protein [Blastocatellia bacterium]|nr:formylglycine-generating enzyme family protein [Blastocatellia bacterium]